MRDGQVVRTTASEMADTRYNRICSKGLSHVRRIYSSKRLQYPMRAGGAEAASSAHHLGRGHHEICAKYQEYAEKDGPASNVLHVGSGNLRQRGPQEHRAAEGCTEMSSSNMSADLETSFAMGNTLGFTVASVLKERAGRLAERAKVFVCWMSDP